MPRLLYLILSVFLLFSFGLSQSVRPYVYYHIRVGLDINKKTVEGTEIITWRNTTKDKVNEMRLHLFHNAYRNENSSYAREGNIKIKKRESGYTDINFIKIVDNFNSIIKTQFIQPDDNNLTDETVLQLIFAKPVSPGEVIKINIGFTTKLPAGGIGRSCYARGANFFFASEWYPKLGVYEEGKGWNCHQHHYWTEFHSDFAFYDIGITLPNEYTVGASSTPKETVKNFDGSKTLFYKEDELNDFAWCASNELIEINDKFSTGKLQPVNIKLLLQKEHLKETNRILYALKNGLKYYGEWLADFPFKNITLVDLPRSCKDYCSAYPALFAIRTSFLQYEDDYSKEEKILHSLGHQYFTSAMAINNVEEPWINEGIVTYLTGRILQKCYGPGKGVFLVADGLPLNGIPIITLQDYPLVAYMGNAFKPYFTSLKSGYLVEPSTDPISKTGWRYQNYKTYRIGTGYKPALMLETMANYFGSNIIFHSLKSYYSLYNHSRSGTEEWISNMEKNLGKKIPWFFEQIFFGTEEIDNSVVSIENREFKDGKYLVDIIFSRKGAVKIPADIKIYLENGSEINDSWDCSERWIKKTYIFIAPATGAIIDPYKKIALDVNTNNNSLTVEGNYKPVLKWAAQWLFWMQTLLQTLCSIC